MTPHKQLFRHKPEEGIYGDCQRTVIACLLDKEPSEVPHFGRFGADYPMFWSDIREYLNSLGYDYVDVLFDGKTPLEEILNFMKCRNPDAYYMLAGQSRTGVDHVVIGLGGEIIWDPSLNDAGIIGPTSNGCYEINFIVPIGFMRKDQ